MNVKSFTLLAAVLLLLSMSLTAPGCSGGPVVTPEDFKDFTRLDIQNAFDAEIVQSSSFSCVITSTKALIDYLSVTKQGETLIVKLSPNHQFTDFTTMRKVLKVKISMPILNGLALSGASRAVVRGFQSTNPLDLNASGTSTTSLDSIKTGDVNGDVSGASDLNGKLTAANVKLVVSGASRVELDGTGNDVQLDVSGASKLDLEQFINKTANVTMSGASQITIDTKDKIDVSLTGASKFFFLDNPSFGKTEVLGASTVKHK